MTEAVIILALIFANGLFAGAEIAVISVRKTRLTQLAEAARPGARAVAALRRDPERFLATVQIGITVVSATAAAFGGHSLAARLIPFFESVGLAAHAEGLSLTVVVVAVSFLSLVLGELVPKSLALRSAERYALFMGRPLLVLARLARPLVWFLTASSNVVLRVFGDKTSFTEARLSPDELRELVDEAKTTGALDAQAGEIASRAFDFAELSVGAVMVPRGRIVALDRAAPADQVRAIALGTRHARLPVYEDGLENVVGYVATREILTQLATTGQCDLAAVIRPAHFVPEQLRAVDVLRDLQRRRLPMALVIDEQGGLSGLVTVEDLVEELVGEIVDEAETLEATVREEPDGRATALGTAPIHEVNRLLDLDLPDGPSWSTLGGLAMALADGIPQAGRRLRAPDGTELEVLEATPRRVVRVRLTPKRLLAGASGPSADGDGR